MSKLTTNNGQLIQVQKDKGTLTKISIANEYNYLFAYLDINELVKLVDIFEKVINGIKKDE